MSKNALQLTSDNLIHQSGASALHRLTSNLVNPLSQWFPTWGPQTIFGGPPRPRGPPGIRAKETGSVEGNYFSSFWQMTTCNIGSTIFYCKLPVNIANSEGCKCNIRTRNFEVLTGHTFISCYMQLLFACSPRALFVEEKFSSVHLSIN